MNDQHGELKYHPAKIEQLQREVADMSQAIQQRREQIDLFESDAQIEIATLRGEDGKLIYGNDVLRKAAFVKNLAANADYRKLSESLSELEKSRLYKIAELERRRLEFKLFLLDREEEIKNK